MVFDGHGGMHSQATRQTRGGVVIVFSPIGKRADDLIKELILKERGQPIVISSDRDIERFAWSHGAIPVGSELFYARLFDEEDESSEHYEIKPAGRLSRKERAVIRALNKL